MYRALPVTGRVASSSSRPALKVVSRRLATDAVQAPKKKSVVKRLFWVTTAATGTFYIGSTFAAFNNQQYYDFFSDNVPLGQPMLEYAEAHNWDTLTVEDVIDAAKNGVVTIQRLTTDLINSTPGAREAVESAKAATEKKIEEAKLSTLKAIQSTRAKVDPVVDQAKSEVDKVVSKVEAVTHTELRSKEQPKPVVVEPKVEEKKEEEAKSVPEKISDDVSELVRKAEDALSGKPAVVEKATEPFSDTPVPSESSPEAQPGLSDKNVYVAPLPIGFEPPPGYVKPSPPKKVEAEAPKEPAPQATKEEEKPLPEVELPLVAPVVESLNVQEPIITHLAGTIDNLASFLKANPAAAEQATGVLENAKQDLSALVERIEKAKEEERTALEAKLDEQTREHTLKLLELEMEAQDKLDSQEEGFRKFFEEERAKFIAAYRAKLDHELKTQTELINERLKEEVIAQGIELQRRWIREIKVRVEQERGGRLAKLDDLAADLKRLERIALDNTAYLDENIRVHALWSAVRSLSSAALESPKRQPFREQLRVLRHVTAAREDPVIQAALSTLESSDVPDIGVEPFADLSSWFTTSVAPKVAEVALVPDENAGVLSYLASKVLSGIRFRKQGLVPGDDVLSVLSRAEYYLVEKDLDSAARELNQLRGPAKALVKDWLDAARRRLEVKQALGVIQTEATLSSLLVA
ncbi:mitochondrial protein [Coprinopsis cinerea okayama7|uniref:MICOS complex subunit MIC60 n=1 Tax=Coprinopsis cinerea (strain Okayama-7 / 130 / ATCC MYA-4618 / FGSC 9003) TaxID=240176 RepID=A8NT57_COPC7|nr:mitochondrial protein [Coprinopsis cinerea okayama7\|eukprot:XP_001836162.1 mitochondrial protein [Coprinopsis cinerea okayama7\